MISSAIVPTRNDTNAARTGLPSQCASCALIPNWNGSIAPAATAKSRYSQTIARADFAGLCSLPPVSLTFGVTVLPDPPYARMIELMQFAERQGFEYAWTYDSHILWQD